MAELESTVRVRHTPSIMRALIVRNDLGEADILVLSVPVLLHAFFIAVPDSRGAVSHSWPFSCA